MRWAEDFAAAWREAADSRSESVFRRTVSRISATPHRLGACRAKLGGTSQSCALKRHVGLSAANARKNNRHNGRQDSQRDQKLQQCEASRSIRI
jgi:hypothetical protein